MGWRIVTFHLAGIYIKKTSKNCNRSCSIRTDRDTCKEELENGHPSLRFIELKELNSI